MRDEHIKREKLGRIGEAGGREWYRFLQEKARNEVTVEEIMVKDEKVHERNEIAVAMKKFWEEISGMNESEVNQDINLLVNESDMSELDCGITWVEVEQIVKKLKNGKAAGLDQISHEMYKWGGPGMIDLLVSLFGKIWNAETVPKRWNENRVILLHKGGQKSKKDLKNYRPIDLMNTVVKTFCMVLNERMRKCFERNEVLSDEQNGFRIDRREEDNTFMVRELMERCKRENRGGYFEFLDIENRVNRNILCKVLNKCGVSEKVVRTINRMYAEIRAKYVFCDIETELVYCKKGVRQGCNLSPLLFSLYTEMILRVKSRAGYESRRG